MPTFSIHTLGCKVNRYESDQIATLLRGRGWRQVERGGELRIVNTCSVTVEAAAKSRQISRRAGRVALPVLHNHAAPAGDNVAADQARPHLVVTGCWATSDRKAAMALPGVDAVLGHGDNVGAELHRLLDRLESAGARLANTTKAIPHDNVNGKLDGIPRETRESDRVKSGTITLPLLNSRQTTHQRAFLKIQDGCDAHCTYCIIPQLRPTLWSKPVDDAVREAQALIDAGHAEIVLTGIFLGAFDQPTALRRRQPAGAIKPIAKLIEALCTRVRGLKRLRLSSLEPGDLSADLIAVLRGHSQIAPHFHLPLQSGSDRLLRRMNRQYTRDDFFRMVDRVHDAFDRPALTTDIITGFPGESDADFADTLSVVEYAAFIHIHAFPFSPRPGTAASRWTHDFIPAPVSQQRLAALRDRAAGHSLHFREGFLNQVVEILVETPGTDQPPDATLHHGRCERYFDVCFEDDSVQPGDAVRLRVIGVAADQTWGQRVEPSLLHLRGSSPRSR